MTGSGKKKKRGKIFRLVDNLWQNSLEMGSTQFHELRSVAGEKGVHLVMGCHEIDGNTLYNTMVFFSANG